MSVIDPVAARIAQVPPLAWVGVALVAAVGVLILHKYNVDPEDTNWLDPGQPAINTELDMKITAANVIGQYRPEGQRAPKPYLAPNLACWSGSWVGDC